MIRHYYVLLFSICLVILLLLLFIRRPRCYYLPAVLLSACLWPPLAGAPYESWGKLTIGRRRPIVGGPRGATPPSDVTGNISTIHSTAGRACRCGPAAPPRPRPRPCRRPWSLRPRPAPPRPAAAPTSRPDGASGVVGILGRLIGSIIGAVSF